MSAGGDTDLGPGARTGGPGAGTGASGVRHASAQFEGAGGVRLHQQAWLPAGDPAAVLAVIHGYGEHGGRHDRLGEAMAGRGYAVCVYDLRGHGLSSGRRGQVDRFGDYLDDTVVFLDRVRAEWPARPLFLLGHSLGGLIGLQFVAERPQGIDGLIISSPFLRMALEVPVSKLIAARAASVVWPRFNVGNTVRAADLSHEPDVVEAYVTDPLVHHVAPARWAAETLAAQNAAPARAGRVEAPLLWLYTDEDAIADPEAGREVFAAAASADKTIMCYEGFRHELFNETDRERVFGDLDEWLQAQLASPRA